MWFYYLMCWSLSRTRFHNVYSPPRVATFRQANDKLRLRRSGEPSRLSLRKSWISPPLKPLLKCAACEYTLQNRWMLEREERNSNDNNEGGGSNWYPATLLFFVNLSLSKKYREASHSSSPFVKSSYITSVPASTQHLGNVYYSSEPFQARS